MPWRLLKYATAAFGAFVAVFGGLWVWLIRSTDRAIRRAF